MPTDYSIGDLARETGCKVQTIRYYEQIGLMPEPARSSGNQRRYDRRHVERLAFIRHARDLGFSIEEVRELLELSDRPDMPCDRADTIARHHLAEVEDRIARLILLRVELKRMIKQCRGGRISDCRIIEALSDHAQCQTPIH